MKYFILYMILNIHSGDVLGYVKIESTRLSWDTLEDCNKYLVLSGLNKTEPVKGAISLPMCSNSQEWSSYE